MGGCGGKSVRDIPYHLSSLVVFCMFVWLVGFPILIPLTLEYSEKKGRGESSFTTPRT